MIRWDAWSFFNNIKFLTYSEKVTDADNFTQKQKKKKNEIMWNRKREKRKKKLKIKRIILEGLAPRYPHEGTQIVCTVSIPESPLHFFRLLV